MENRNALMIARIESTPVRYPFHFAVAGVTAKAPNPQGDAIFSEIVGQISQLDPQPLFFANLGDFAGPGSMDRHQRYLRLAEPLDVPNICVIGAHERDDPAGEENYQRVHGPVNFQFAHGHTRFVVINSNNDADPSGPGERDLAFLDQCLRSDDHKVRIVMMHMPPNLQGHYAPRGGSEWGFKALEPELLSIVKQHEVDLVCCSHIMGFDYYVYEGIPFVLSGAAGYILDGVFGGTHREGYAISLGVPPHRGSFFHFVQIAVEESGAISGRVHKAFEGPGPDPRYGFGKGFDSTTRTRQ